MKEQTEDQSNLIYDIEQIKKRDWYRSYSIDTNHTFSDSDKIKTLYVTTSTNTITVTLPAAANNLDRIIEILKIDSAFDITGAGSKITIDGAGSETINGQTTIDIELQYCGIKIKSDGSKWYVLNEIGDCELRSIDGTLEMVYRKFYIGTTAASTTTNVAHNLDFDKIISAVAHIYNGSIYCIYDFRFSTSTSQYYFYLTSVNLSFGGVGAALQSQNYRISVEYYV